MFIKSAPFPIFIPPGETQNKFPFSDKDIGLFIKLPFREDTPIIKFLYFSFLKRTLFIEPLVSKELNR
jgi:hypothetical protein